MQILNQQQGLLPYPGADIGPGIDKLGNTVLQFAMLKKQIEDEKAQKKLDLYLKTGEITGDIEAATPEIQKAFKKIYGIEPSGIFKTGGETLSGRKAKAEVANLEAEKIRKESMADWYKKRGALDKVSDTKGLDYAVKYANAKLGKPFEVLSDEERGLWQQFHDEGLEEWETKKSGSQTSKYNDAQLGFINSWKSLTSQEKNKITNPIVRQKVETKLKALGLTMTDLK